MLAHACPACGHDEPWAGRVYRFQDDRRSDDVEDLRREARKRGDDVGELIAIVADRLRSEDNATDEAIRAVRESYDAVIRTLEEAARRPLDPLSVAVLNANREGLEQILRANGLLAGQAGLRDELRRMVELANRSSVVQGVPRGIVAFDAPAVRAALARIDENFWQGKIERPAAQLIRENLSRALTLESLPQTIRTIKDRLETSIARATTEARTEIAIFDRFVSTQTAELGGLRKWIYLGPLDELTRRPFCRALVGKVVSHEQMQELDNGQIPNPLVSGGGWNCRHRWVPMSDAFIERHGLPLATSADIRAASSGGRSGRRRGRR